MGSLSSAPHQTHHTSLLEADGRRIIQGSKTLAKTKEKVYRVIAEN
jgi:hypothetical protein